MGYIETYIKSKTYVIAAHDSDDRSVLRGTRSSADVPDVGDKETRQARDLHKLGIRSAGADLLVDDQKLERDLKGGLERVGGVKMTGGAKNVRRFEAF